MYLFPARFKLHLYAVNIWTFNLTCQSIRQLALNICVPFNQLTQRKIRKNIAIFILEILHNKISQRNDGTKKSNFLSWNINTNDPRPTGVDKKQQNLKWKGEETGARSWV